MTAEASVEGWGICKTQISVWKDNTEILSTQVFEINVTKTLLGNSSVESSNEYGTLVLLFQNLYEAYDLNDRRWLPHIGMPASSCGRKYNLATMWQGVGVSGGIYGGRFDAAEVEEALANASVQGVLDMIGTSGG